MKKIKLGFLLLIIVSLMVGQVFVVHPRSNRSYDDLVEAFMNLADDYPDLMSYETIGFTVEEREIMMFKIGNPGGERIVFDGAIHGWENVGSEVLYFYARWLLTSGESIAQDILGRVYTLLIPALNIDSYNETRKNSNRVDLNRNFASGWERSGSDDPWSEYYHGPSPVSEPESQALIGILKKYKPRFYGNLHEGGVYYAGSRSGNASYYAEIVDKVKDFAGERGIHPYYYQGEFRGSGLSISDAANLGIMSFIFELHDPHVPDNTETDVFPRFWVIAVVLSQEISSDSIDVIPPVTTHSYDGLWHSSNLIVSLSAQDDKSGVNDVYYRVNGGIIKTVSVNGQPLIDVEGSDNFLEYWGVDNRGNEENHKTLTGIKLDKTYPTIEVITNITDIQINASQELKILVNFTDSLSGIDNVIFSYNINEQNNWIYLPMTFDSNVDLFQTSIPPQNEVTSLKYQIEAYDNAGNKKIQTENIIDIPEFPNQIVIIIFLIIGLLLITIKTKGMRSITFQ